jgi:hypothetical protein
VRIPVYLCPSDPNDRPRLDGAGVVEHSPVNYGVNLGVWEVFDPVSGVGGAGTFHPNSRIAPRDIQDGLSQTLLAAEVKAYTAYFRNAAAIKPSRPEAANAVCRLGGQFKSPPPKDPSGHTEWVDGRAHQTGFTATFPPNARRSLTFVATSGSQWKT